MLGISFGEYFPGCIVGRLRVFLVIGNVRVW